MRLYSKEFTAAVPSSSSDLRIAAESVSKKFEKAEKAVWAE